MLNPKPFESVEDRVERCLVLVHLRPGSGTDRYVRMGGEDTRRGTPWGGLLTEGQRKRTGVGRGREDKEEE